MITLFCVGQSCAEILMISPGCKDLSGYYWVERANGSATQVSQLIVNVYTLVSSRDYKLNTAQFLCPGATVYT